MSLPLPNREEKAAMKYTAFFETQWTGTHEIGTFDTPEEAHEAIIQMQYDAGLQLGVDCCGCAVEHE